MPWKTFQVNYKGKSGLLVNLPRSGISYNLDLEIALAAHWWGHKTMMTWQRLPMHEQVYNVAVYRAQNLVTNLSAFEQAEKAERFKRRGVH